MGHGSRVVDSRAFGRRDRGSKPPPPFQSFGNFVYPTLPVSFGRDSKNRWSLLSGVYARGSKRSHVGKWKKPVMDSLALEKDTLKTRRTTLEISVIWCALMCYPQYYWIPKNNNNQQHNTLNTVLVMLIFIKQFMSCKNIQK